MRKKVYIIQDNFLGDDVTIIADSDSPEEAFESIMAAVKQLAEELNYLDLFTLRLESVAAECRREVESIIASKENESR